MLKILPCTDRNFIDNYCQKYNIAFTQGLYFYNAEENGEELASALFEIKSDYVQIICFVGETDHFIFDAILRAGFNYAAENGVNYGYISEVFRIKYSTYFEKLIYPQATKFDIINFITKYKHCLGG